MAKRIQFRRRGGFAFTHYRMPYHRPSWQGGDTAQALCKMPLNGIRNAAATRYPMTDCIGKVDCPACRRMFARGAARSDHLALQLASRGRVS